MIKRLEMLEDGMASRKTCAPKKNNIEQGRRNEFRSSGSNLENSNITDWT